MIDGSKTLILPEDEGMEDIMEHLSNLLSIVEGTQPLDRSLGLKADYIGMPMPVAQNRFALDVYDKISRYEPRVEVVDIQFVADTGGTVIPQIKIRRA